MIRLKVTARDEVSSLLAEYLSSLTGPELAGLNAVGGRAATEDAADYNRDFDRAGKWRGKRYQGKGGSEGSDFGAAVARGWAFGSSDQSGATISNDADHFAFKVTGGTITAKRVEHLTLPMVPEARGRRVKDYEIFAQTRLFRVKGKKALFESRDGKFRAVYALVESVTQGPWPGALPSEDRLAESFSMAWRQEMERRIEKA